MDDHDDTEYQYHPNPFREEANQATLEEKIFETTDEDFQIFYKKLLVRLGINRHSDPALQLKAILSVDRSILLKLFLEFEGTREDAS